MTRKVLRLMLWVVPVLALLGAAVFGVAQEKSPERERSQGEISVATLRSQAVLTTLHRGPFLGLGKTYAKLHDILRKNGLKVKNDDGVVVVLNRTDNDAERLLEIQLPLDELSFLLACKRDAALQKSAQEMGLARIGFHRSPATRAVRVVKPKGVDDPAPLYQRAEAFLQENRLTPADRPPFQRFTGVSRIPETCVYSELQTEIFLPVD